MINGAVDAPAEKGEVRGRPSASNELHRLCVALPGDRAAVTGCKQQPESYSPNAVQTLHLDGGDTGDHSVRSSSSSTAATAAAAASSSHTCAAGATTSRKTRLN